MSSKPKRNAAKRDNNILQKKFLYATNNITSLQEKILQSREFYYIYINRDEVLSDARKGDIFLGSQYFVTN